MVTNEQAIESSVVSMRSGWGRSGISAAWLLRCGTKGDGDGREQAPGGKLKARLWSFGTQSFLF